MKSTWGTSARQQKGKLPPDKQRFSLVNVSSIVSACVFFSWTLRVAGLWLSVVPEQNFS